MWSTKIIQVLKKEGRVSVFVEFTNGSETFTEEFSTNNASSAWLKAQIRSKIASFENSYTFADSLVINSTVDVTETPPTAAEIETREWLDDYHRWLSVKKAIDSGILTGNEAPVQTLLNKVKNSFKAAYLTLI